jgi:cell shape-determining protein MreC
MPKPLLTPRRSLLILALLLFVNAMLPERHAQTAGYIPATVVNFAAAPLAAPLKSLSGSLRAREPDRIEMGTPADVEVQYQLALQRLRQLEAELDEAQRLIMTLTQSREMLSLAGTRLVPARAWGFAGERVRPVVNIDRGRSRGIHEGMAVVHGINLVGRVDRAYANTADVELITAPNSRLQVRILPPRTDEAPRELVEILELAPDRRTFRVQVKIDAPVQQGDLAHLIDERWPAEARGYVVGQVVRVNPDPSAPHSFRIVEVRPLAPLESLNRLTVLAPIE